jgi:hypothetical protein
MDKNKQVEFTGDWGDYINISPDITADELEKACESLSQKVRDGMREKGFDLLNYNFTFVHKKESGTLGFKAIFNRDLLSSEQKAEIKRKAKEELQREIDARKAKTQEQ